jgi:dTDP-4-dehydrorhamnose reductase
MNSVAGVAGSSVASQLELWGGIECTVNRVGDRYHDQLDLTGHSGRLTDLDLVATLGIRRLRYPLLWERVAPSDPLRCDWRWIDSRLTALRSLGVAPIAGLLHHGSGPAHTTLLDPEFPARFARYAAGVAARFPWIDAYTPINEPLTTARFCGLYGHWYPHARADTAFVTALVNQCRATVLAMRAIRTLNPAAQLIQTDDAGKTFSTPALAYQARFENHRRWLGWDLLCGLVDRTHPLWPYLRSALPSTRDLEWLLDNPCPPDIVGLNYYVTSDRYLDEQVQRYPAGSAGGNGRDVYVDVEAVRACRGISGHRAILNEAWLRYRRPMAITEVHLGSTREEQMRWMLEAWNAAHSARRDGIDVRAVTAWALFGLTDWDSLVTRLDGHYEPGAYDVRGPQPRATALAALVTDMASGRELSQPVFDSPGWWRRPGRLWVVPHPETYPDTASLPIVSMRYAARSPRGTILITGGGGTLATAFARICAARGLGCEVLPRQSLDITDRQALAAALARVQPWAIINAAGYVRVDEAEADQEQCRRTNTLGPQRLAEACFRRGLRLLSFSSDLVFDGCLTRPYIESDTTTPLSAYGRSKADAERAVLAAHPQALMVRTSAFFGPWDSANVVYRAAAAFAVGQVWRAAGDQRIAPTYVPDLVNVALDLLIDGAHGIWHLANAGDVSWSEFARQTAHALGYRDHLVEECRTAALELPAARPSYSVLGTERGQRLPPLDDALRRYADERHDLRCRLSPHRGTAA